MRLRPHHLLCTQGYSGNGYSKEFVTHMNEVVAKLRDSQPIEIELVLNTDEICTACPHKLGEDLCATNEKVKGYDKKIMNYFNLEENKTYVYQEVVKEINEQMTIEKMQDICMGCRWYEMSACRKNILGDDYKG